MPKSPNEMIDAVVKNLPAKTGKTAEQWVEISKNDGPEGFKAQVDWLKKEHGLGQVQASLIAQFLKQGGNLYADGDKLVDELFSDKNASLRPLYDSLMKEITGLGSDVRIQPAVTMVVFYCNKKFAQVRPMGGAIEMRLAMSDRPVKKDTKTGVVERMNVKRAIAGKTDIEGLRAELKMAYDLN